MRPANGSACVLNTYATSRRPRSGESVPRPARARRSAPATAGPRRSRRAGGWSRGSCVATPHVTGKMPLLHAVLERRDDLLVGDLLALEVALHQLVGVLGDLVHQLLAVLLGLRLELVGDRDLLAVLAAVALGTRRPSCRRGRSRRGPRVRRRSGSRSRRRAGRRSPSGCPGSGRSRPARGRACSRRPAGRGRAPRRAATGARWSPRRP